jgi:hypothetical protein
MRKKTPAGPCRTLSAEQRAEIERQLRVEGRLRTANKVELERLRAARRLRAASETAKVICERTAPTRPSRKCSALKTSKVSR